MAKKDFARRKPRRCWGLTGNQAAIVVTGGGIVLRPENVELLRELGTVVHLAAEEETLFARISRRSTRPLLRTENPRATLLLSSAEPTAGLPRGGGHRGGHVAALA